jgi:Sec-independent protein secretion pathway component TatC
MWFLFEVGVFISRLLLRRRQEARAAETAESAGEQ